MTSLSMGVNIPSGQIALMWISTPCERNSACRPNENDNTPAFVAA